MDGEHWCRIHGGYHYGPAPALAYYREHGFHVSERDWHNCEEHRGAWRVGYGPDEERYRDAQNWCENNEGACPGDEYQGPDHQHDHSSAGKQALPVPRTFAFSREPAMAFALPSR